MKSEERERWQGLRELAAKEQDSHKLSELIAKIGRILKKSKID